MMLLEETCDEEHARRTNTLLVYRTGPVEQQHTKTLRDCRAHGGLELAEYFYVEGSIIIIHVL
jgi:hypothetical protein